MVFIYLMLQSEIKELTLSMTELPTAGSASHTEDNV